MIYLPVLVKKPGEDIIFSQDALSGYCLIKETWNAVPGRSGLAPTIPAAEYGFMPKLSWREIQVWANSVGTACPGCMDSVHTASQQAHPGSSWRSSWTVSWPLPARRSSSAASTCAEDIVISEGIFYCRNLSVASISLRKGGSEGEQLGGERSLCCVRSWMFPQAAALSCLPVWEFFSSVPSLGSFQLHAGHSANSASNQTPFAHICSLRWAGVMKMPRFLY